MSGESRVEGRDKKVVVIGGGPAGLTAAYALARAGIRSVVLEQDDLVGGHARTVEHNGFLIDVGGHRFFTGIPEVKQIWRELMGSSFLQVPRLSRIFYNGRFFQYPLRPFEALWQMGLFESAWVLVSYIRKQLVPIPNETNLEEWMSNRFGRRLFLMFFKLYTEKVWGLPCTEIRAEWAAQRIKSLTLGKAILGALRPGRSGHRSLVEAFEYPERGPGMLWGRMADRLRDGGQEVLLQRGVLKLKRSGFHVDAAVTRHRDAIEEVRGTDFIASMAISDLVRGLDPPAPPEILADADALRYRDFFTVALMIRRASLFPDQWLYIHTPEVNVARIQNYGNWSPAMVPGPGVSCLGMEYFCNDTDEIWRRPDTALVEMAKTELQRIGLARAEEVFDAHVLRQRKAYPVYDARYREHLDRLRDYLLRFDNLQMVGRNGLHKYNNQDHAMLTSLLAVRNILGERLDVWGVNTAEEYHEGYPTDE